MQGVTCAVDVAGIIPETLQHIPACEGNMYAVGRTMKGTYAVRIALSDSWTLRQSNLPFWHHGTVTGSKGAVPFSGPGAMASRGAGAGARPGAANALGACIAAVSPKAAYGCSAALWALLPHFSLPCSCSIHLLSRSPVAARARGPSHSKWHSRLHVWRVPLRRILCGPVRASGYMQVCLRVHLPTIPRWAPAPHPETDGELF